MGLFDDALKKAVPNGDLATPIAVAAGALILGKMFGAHLPGAPAAPAAPAAPMAPPAPAPAAGGSVLSGLNDIIGKLTASGQVGPVNSWVGNGANQPINPNDLGGALGQQVLQQLSAKTGLSQDQLLQGLSQVLPKLVNNLTPNGTLPTLAQLGE